MGYISVKPMLLYPKIQISAAASVEECYEIMAVHTTPKRSNS